MTSYSFQQKCTDEDIAQGGLSCTEEAPCPVYAELTAVAALGSKIFISGNLHSDSITMYSLLLESDDAGETWTEPIARIRGASFPILKVKFPRFRARLGFRRNVATACARSILPDHLGRRKVLASTADLR